MVLDKRNHASLQYKYNAVVGSYQNFLLGKKKIIMQQKDTEVQKSLGGTDLKVKTFLKVPWVAQSPKRPTSAGS